MLCYQPIQNFSFRYGNKQIAEEAHTHVCLYTYIYMYMKRNTKKGRIVPTRLARDQHYHCMLAVKNPGLEGTRVPDITQLATRQPSCTVRGQLVVVC